MKMNGRHATIMLGSVVVPPGHSTMHDGLVLVHLVRVSESISVAFVLPMARGGPNEVPPLLEEP